MYGVHEERVLEAEGMRASTERLGALFWYEYTLFVLFGVAKIMFPSADDESDVQLYEPAGDCCIQVPPKSGDVYMYPGFTAATNRVPYADDAIAYQFAVGEDAERIQFTP